MKGIEEVVENDNLLALIVRHSAVPSETRFLTPFDANFQVGFIVKQSGEDVEAHSHKPLQRSLRGTAEVLFVKKGVCELDLFGPTGVLVTTRRLGTGDAVLLLDGGHGIRIIEPTVFLEVKQGPYPGRDEKDPL